MIEIMCLLLSSYQMGDLVDCLYNCWRSDSVHGDKSAYLKLAMALLDFDPRLPGRKRRRPSSPGSDRGTSSDRGASPAEQTRGRDERPAR